MKNLLLLIAFAMLFHTCLCAVASEPKGEQSHKLRSTNSETNMYAREGALEEEEHKLLMEDTVVNNKKGASIFSDCVAFAGNILTSCCSPRVACVGIVSVMGIYGIFNQLTYGVEYCSQSFPNADSRCIDISCLEKNNLQKSYLPCRNDRLCWRENHDKYEVCLNDECAYAQEYCDNTMAVCLAFMCISLILCMKSCASLSSQGNYQGH